MAEAVRLVVPFGRDGASDRAARVVARRLSAAGIEVDVENWPGQGGLTGLQHAAGLDGPVLVLGTPSTHVLVPVLEPLEWRSFDSARRWSPLLGLGSSPNVLLVSPRLGAATVQELIAIASGPAAPLTYASAGSNQTIHLCSAYFCRLAGLTMRHRPYAGGSADAYDDLVAGRVQVYFDNLLGCVDRVAAGDAIPVAVSSSHRVDALPQVATLVELGYPQHVFEIWMALWGAGLEAGVRALLESMAGDAGFAGELRRVGLSGGPIPASTLVTTIDASGSRWIGALESARIDDSPPNPPQNGCFADAG